MKWISTSRVNDVDIPEQDLAVRVCPFDLVILGLERWIEVDMVMRVHGINFANVSVPFEAIGSTVSMSVDTIRHDAALIHRRGRHLMTTKCLCSNKEIKDEMETQIKVLSGN